MRFLSSLRSSAKFLVNHEGFAEQPLLCIVRALDWYRRVAIGSPIEVSINSWGVKYKLPALYRTPAKVFYVFRENYEPELPFFADFIKPGDVVFDIGANFGLFAVLAGKIAGPAGKVWVFEPAQDGVALIKENISWNSLSNVVLFESALSDQDGTGRLYLHDNPGKNTLGQFTSGAGRYEEIQLRRLDALPGIEALDRLDFIKIDAEGAEELVFKGASETIDRFKPAILFEVNSKAAEQLGLNGLGATKLLQEKGYEFFRIAREKGLSPANGSHEGNILAFHPETKRSDAKVKSKIISAN